MAIHFQDIAAFLSCLVHLNLECEMNFTVTDPKNTKAPASYTPDDASHTEPMTTFPVPMLSQRSTNGWSVGATRNECQSICCFSPTRLFRYSRQYTTPGRYPSKTARTMRVSASVRFRIRRECNWRPGMPASLQASESTFPCRPNQREFLGSPITMHWRRCLFVVPLSSLRCNSRSTL